MEKHIVKIEFIEKVTHDVIKIVTEKPDDYKFSPGQATDVTINKPGWQEEKRPFTFTCLPDDDYLEFTIKTYPEHKGVTNELLKLKKKDELILHEVFGAISYKKEGVFIAGGAGITPFISIFRHLQKQNKIGNNVLVFANKTKADIILKKELKNMLGNAFINILSDEKVVGYHHGRITEDFLKAILSGVNQQFYVCGPPPMMEAVLNQLINLGVNKNAITKEKI
jgi:ferredoxin-NADP reductase